MSEYTPLRFRQKMPYEPNTKQPFGITTWATVPDILVTGGLAIRIYQNVSGEIVRVEAR